MSSLTTSNAGADRNPRAPSGLRRRLLRRPEKPWRVLTIYAGVLTLLFVLAYPLDLGALSTTAKVLFWIGLWPFLGWLFWLVYNRLLWHVGGRLAFSYFLIGVVPIPLVLALFLIIAYGFTGFYLSRVFHEEVRGLEEDLVVAATRPGGPDGEGAPRLAPTATATYRDGERVDGDPRAPAVWPAAVAENPASAEARQPADPEGPVIPSFWMPLAGGSGGTGGTLTLAVVLPPDGGSDPATGEPAEHTIAFYDGDAEAEIRERSGLWVSFSDETRSRGIQVSSVSIQIDDTDRLSPRRNRERVAEEDENDLEEVAETAEGEDESAEADSALQRFFAARAVEPGTFADRPFFRWVTVVDQPVIFEGRESEVEEQAEAGVGVFLQATPRIVGQSLFGTQAELVRGFWVALLVASFLLLAIYAVAELVAISMIVGISRAVSRLYAATHSVAAGDFKVRIPVRRRDQVGAVQRSFNTMAENLEDLVSTAAQAELLEKELEMARQVQQSLIPWDLPASERVEFSTLFEPSAAIGGDYFDVLRLSETELAVVVADVSGHGLPTGLRMAMVKAALGILVVETHEADEILRRLDTTVRSGDSQARGGRRGSRFFVTAVFSKVDFREGAVEITNAGHPPAYHLRDGAVEEVLLTGSPLGGLGHQYGRRRIELADGDVLVWLSDGLIEASNAEDDPFGYDRTAKAVAGPAESAQQVRDRLLAAVAEHTGGRAAQDDRTLVVMRYRA